MVWLVVKAEYAEGGNDTVLYNVVREALSGETTKPLGKESKQAVQLSESRWFCIEDPEEKGLWS